MGSSVKVQRALVCETEKQLGMELHPEYLKPHKILNMAPKQFQCIRVVLEDTYFFPADKLKSKLSRLSSIQIIPL